MDGLFILAAIAWIVLSAVNKKKRREQQEAQKGAAQGQPGTVPPRGSVAAPSMTPPPVRPKETPAPVRQAPPTATPWPRMPDAAFATEKKPAPGKPAFSGAAAEGDSAPAQARARGERLAGTLNSRMNTSMQSTLRGTTLQHTLEVSGISGHAHEETSITGVQSAPCKPEQPRKKAAAPVAAASAPLAGGFVWSQDQVLQGMVLSEILGKPRCLRQNHR